MMIVVLNTVKEGIIIVEGSLTLVVESGEEECFVIRAPGKEDSFISGNFDCLDDELDPRPIRVSLLGPNDDEKELWTSPEGESEASFTITGRGRYQLCIANNPDYVREMIEAIGDDEEEVDDELEEDRTVGFSVHVHPVIPTDYSQQQQQQQDEEKKKDAMEEKKEKELELQAKKRTNLLYEMSHSISEGLSMMVDHQDYLKFREAAHREVTERTFSRVVSWTVIEAIVLVVISAGQVFYLKKFFETKQYL